MASRRSSRGVVRRQPSLVSPIIRRASGMLFLTLLTTSLLSWSVNAQNPPVPTAATSSPQAAGYTCDATACKLPACNCASTSPPGGLSPQDTPMFVTVTADDAIQVYTKEVVETMLANRTNPNGCRPKMTYFSSLAYTNYSMITDFYVSTYYEIADHTMTHVGTPNNSEILGNLAALNAFSGIPVSSIQGFRAPYLNYTADTLRMLNSAGFKYDSSSTSATPASMSSTDAFWPYTLDYGYANDCLDVDDACQGILKLPGFWEIPMYAVFENQSSASGIHLMDPWLDNPDPQTVLGWLKDSFLSHYNGNRQPFGLYTHPIHLAIGYPGLVDPIATREMVIEFLDWMQTYPNVWFVNNQQLLDWVRDPVPISQLASATTLQCKTPQVDPSLKICNGITPNEEGLLINCPFYSFPFTTCYGCPTIPPEPDNPVPLQNASLGIRYHLPANCSTAFFDPVKNTCLCQDSACAFTDNTGPIMNITSPSSNSSSSSSSASSSSSSSTASGKAGSSPSSLATRITIGDRSFTSSSILPMMGAMVVGVMFGAMLF